jgi:hypothetical protein
MYYEDIWESAGIAQSFLTSTLGAREWLPSRRGHFNFRDICPDIHWIGGWVDPRVGLNAVEKRTIFHAGNRTRVVQPEARR